MMFESLINSDSKCVTELHIFSCDIVAWWKLLMGTFMSFLTLLLLGIMLLAYSSATVHPVVSHY